MSQETLADACNVTQGTISRWERGAATPRCAQRQTLQALFGDRLSAPDPIELHELAALKGLTLSVDTRGLWTITQVVGKALTSAQVKARLT